MSKNNGNAMVDYAHVPTLEEYSEWFKDHFDFYREDGILQVSMKTADHEMYWSGAAHRAMSQCARIISMDYENEIIIWTHKGENWMKDSDPNGWERYGQERFQHQYFDDENLIKNMIFDIQVPTIGVFNGPGIHWDSSMLCDITIAADDAKWDDQHLHFGMVPGDGMGMMLQYFLGTKRGNYYAYTGRQFDTTKAVDMGWVSEVVPKDQCLNRAWEIARMLKKVPYETRCIWSHLAKRPLQKLWVEDFKLHTTSEIMSTYIKIAQGQLGDARTEEKKTQLDEKYMGVYFNWMEDQSVDDMKAPQTPESWEIHERAMKWQKEHPNKNYHDDMKNMEDK